MCVQSVPGGIGRNAIAGTKCSSEVLAAQMHGIWVAVGRGQGDFVCCCPHRGHPKAESVPG